MTTVTIRVHGVTFEREASCRDVVLRGDQGGEALVFDDDAPEAPVEIHDLARLLRVTEPEECGSLEDLAPSEREWDRALERAS